MSINTECNCFACLMMGKVSCHCLAYSKVFSITSDKANHEAHNIGATILILVKKGKLAAIRWDTENQLVRKACKWVATTGCNDSAIFYGGGSGGDYPCCRGRIEVCCQYHFHSCFFHHRDGTTVPRWNDFQIAPDGSNWLTEESQLAEVHSAGCHPVSSTVDWSKDQSHWGGFHSKHCPIHSDTLGHWANQFPSGESTN